MSTPTHIRSTKVFTFSPTFPLHHQYFQSPTKLPTRRKKSPIEQVVQNAFSSDFDQHCRRIVAESFPYLTRTDLEELLVDLHFVSGKEQWKHNGRELVERLWERTKDSCTGLADKEGVKKMLMTIVGIEKGEESAAVQRDFRSFATSRLRYLHLQAHAITGSGSPSPPRSNITSPKPPKPQRLLTTVKVNLTPQKSAILTVYQGDDVAILAREFAAKHNLGQNEASKLLTLLSLKLKSAASP